MIHQTATRVEGIGNLQEGSYGDIHIDGLVNITGDISFMECNMNGIGKAMGSLEGEILRVDGSLKTKGNVKVKKLAINGLMRCGEVKVYADAIYIEGLLESKDEISADIIRVDGLIRVPILSGDDIELNYAKAKIKGLIMLPFKTFRFHLNKIVQGVDTIECTKLKATNLISKNICAQEIYLMDHCCIDVIECDGDIYMDATCSKKEIRGEYQLHRI